MKICIIRNELKDPDNKNTNYVISILEELGFSYFVAKNITINNKFNYTDKNLLPKDIDMILTLGGDGTILKVTYDLKELNLPIIGVNLGTLGFLAGIELSELRELLNAIKNNNYFLEERMMLDSYFSKDDREKLVCLNDIVIKNENPIKMARVTLYVNNKKVNSYEADGLIISSPTGSTAYNFSVNGPIVDPTSSLITITPIASHNLGIKSIVFSGDSEIKLRIDRDRRNENQNILVIGDGEKVIKCNSDDEIYVRKSNCKTTFVRHMEKSFIDVLRKKMRDN